MWTNSKPQEWGSVFYLYYVLYDVILLFMLNKWYCSIMRPLSIIHKCKNDRHLLVIASRASFEATTSGCLSFLYFCIILLFFDPMFYFKYRCTTEKQKTLIWNTRSRYSGFHEFFFFRQRILRNMWIRKNFAFSFS